MHDSELETLSIDATSTTEQSLDPVALSEPMNEVPKLPNGSVDNTDTIAVATPGRDTAQGGHGRGRGGRGGGRGARGRGRGVRGGARGRGGAQSRGAISESDSGRESGPSVSSSEAHSGSKRLMSSTGSDESEQKRPRTSAYTDPFAQQTESSSRTEHAPLVLKLVPHHPTTAPSATNPRLESLRTPQEPAEMFARDLEQGPSSNPPNPPNMRLRSTSPSFSSLFTHDLAPQKIFLSPEIASQRPAHIPISKPTDLLGNIDPRLRFPTTNAHSTSSQIPPSQVVPKQLNNANRASVSMTSDHSSGNSRRSTTCSPSELSRGLSVAPPSSSRDSNLQSAPIRKPAVLIPKALTNTIDGLTAKIAKLESDLKAANEANAKLKKTCSGLAAENIKLQTADAKLAERLVALEASSAEQSTAIAKLAEMVKQTNTTSSGTVEHAVKKIKDNAFNTAIRKAFLASMGLTTTENLPGPLNDGFFDTDPETKTNLRLRPDFTKGFNENSAWHSWLCQWKGEAIILDRIKTSFKGFQNKYKQSIKTDDVVIAGRRDGRHKQRKATKRMEREMCREELGLEAKEYDFLFTAGYQSTDESDGNDGIDPLTDTEQELPVSTTQKPWISHPHTHRSATVTKLIRDLDCILFRRREKNLKERKATDKKNAACPHNRIRGAPRNRRLPRPRKGEPRVPRDAIDPTWLAENLDEDHENLIGEYNLVERKVALDDFEDLYQMKDEDGNELYDAYDENAECTEYADEDYTGYSADNDVDVRDGEQWN
ncbi:hypothetical protein BD410DRAFT_843851 [Rickenella mellea]|uniref:Uncharacterized protein n=1 Tax=Rickenella mellea TaxID=50990 RepID=A0A4Y7PP45_9AGAM|nr:hypothetical protein BD410DRAFT_843851 [Rickenella mellea]